jgi:hypothetical protein
MTAALFEVGIDFLPYYAYFVRARNAHGRVMHTPPLPPFNTTLTVEDDLTAIDALDSNEKFRTESLPENMNASTLL